MVSQPSGNPCPRQRLDLQLGLDLNLRSFHVGISWSTQGAGGSGRVLQALTDYLPAEGVSVEGAVMAPAHVAEETQGQFHLLAPPGANFPARLRSSRRCLQAAISSRPDVLASHFALFTIPALDQLRRLPFIMHFHGPWADESRVQGANQTVALVKRSVERAVYHRAQCVITLSAAFANVLTTQYGVDASRIRIVPGSADLERFCPPSSKQEVRDKLEWDTHRPTLVAVRRLVPRMGLENLIQAMATVRRTLPDVQLYIGGKGPLADQLAQQIRALDLEQNVHLLGFVSEEALPMLYQAADLSVVPTLALEGFGLVAAESLAAGTPVLVTPTGGLPEVVAGLPESLVFRSSSSADIAERIVAVLTGAAELPSAAVCRAHAGQHFSPARMARQVAEVYRELC